MHRYIAAVRANSDAAARESLENVVDLLVTSSCTSFEDCVAWARKLFEVSADEVLRHKTGLVWHVALLTVF